MVLSVGNSLHSRSFAQSNFETAVRFYDKDLFHSSLTLADEMKVHVRGFYHVTEALMHWKEIFEEHLMIMDGKRFQSNLFSKNPTKSSVLDSKRKNKLTTGWSSVFDIIDKLQITFEGSDAAYSNLTTLYNAMHIRSGTEKIDSSHYNHTLDSHSNVFGDLSAADRHSLSEIFGEIHTMNELHRYCTARTTARERAFVFYLHNHETACSKHSAAPASVDAAVVHDVVNSFVVEFPAVCLAALLGGYSSCGVDFAHGQYENNVWW